MTTKGEIKSAAANLFSSVGILNFLWNREPSWRILMYHRVCNPEDLAYPLQAGMYVRPETFRMHCEMLKKNSNVISVDELLSKLINNEKLPKRTVAITFDDGWKDNLENAFPLLKAANLPAAIFLPTEYIDTPRLFWTDEIARALKFSPELFFKFKDQPIDEQLESALAWLFSLPRELREKSVAELTKALPPNENREFLTWEEVSKLDYFGVKVGSHSHTHRLFKELSNAERINELEQSRDILKAKALLTSRVFVFPGGSHTSEMGGESISAGYLSSLKTSREYNRAELIYPRVGIHEDISSSESLFKLRLALV